MIMMLLRNGRKERKEKRNTMIIINGRKFDIENAYNPMIDYSNPKNLIKLMEDAERLANGKKGK